MLPCALLFMVFYCNIEVFFFFFYPHAVGVFISWLNTCSNSWTQLPQTRSLCWVIFGGDGSSEEVGRAFRPLWGEKSVLSCGLLLFGFRSPSPHHSHRAEKADAVMRWHPFCKAELNHSWYPEREEQFVSYVSCYILFFFFFSFTGALVCVVLGGRGVEQTNKKKTDFPPQWCHCRKLKKQRLYGLDFLGSGGGGHQESLPTWPPTSEIKEAKNGDKKDRKENNIIWFYQNQTDTNLYGR